MSEAQPRSSTFRRVLIYFGAAAPLPGDEDADGDDLEGDLRTIREVLHWVAVGAAIGISGAAGETWAEHILALVIAVLVLGVLLRAFNAWAVRRQRARRA